MRDGTVGRTVSSRRRTAVGRSVGRHYEEEGVGVMVCCLRVACFPHYYYKSRCYCYVDRYFLFLPRFGTRPRRGGGS